MDSEDSPSSDRRECRVIFLGMNGVGKTSLYMRIKENKFYKNTTDLNTDEGFTKSIRVGEKDVQMTLYDSASGMERYHRTLTKDYYRDSFVALCVYSADSIDSVGRVLSCIEDVNKNAPEAKKLVIRNKIDLEDQTVREHEVTAKFNEFGYNLSNDFKQICTSASNGDGIDKLLVEIGKGILARKALQNIEEVKDFNSFKVNQGKNSTENTSTEKTFCGC